MSLDTPYVRGAEKLAQRIETIRRNTGVTLASPILLQKLKESTLRRFAAQVSPTGESWAGADELTLKRKKYAGFGAKQLLVRTVNMRDAIDVIRGFTPGQLATATGAEGRIGIKNPIIANYARFHQFGIGVEQRRFLGISKADVVMIDSALRRAIIQASGLG